MRWTAMLALLAGCLAGPRALAATQVSTQAKLFLKMASYDANFPASRSVDIGLFYLPNDEEQLATLKRVFGRLSGSIAQGRTVAFALLPYHGPASVASYVASKAPYAIFLSEGVPPGDVPALRALAKQHGLLTFAAEPRLVELGISASVETSDDRPRVVLNARALLEANRQLDSSFLSMARLIR